ncbi:MAG: sulfite exporter TauE/SafE family protein [Dehalococcoidia bacterium]|nr:sulfite exporter TauE/SafE family protein [Dehalococcoidia bacterium]
MPADVNIWILAIAGFGAGMLGSMLGIGGGAIIVPVLTLALGIPIQYAIGSSLVSIVINACTATGVYIQKQLTNLKLGLLMATTLIPGAVAGAFIAAVLSSNVLIIIFAILLFYVAYTMVPQKQHKLPQAGLEEQNNVREKDAALHGWLDDSYYDPAVNEEVHYRVHRPATGMGTAFFGGVLSSMLGIGGGIVNVPVMNRIMKVPIKATIATSSLMLCFTTMTGALIYALHGYVLPSLIAPLCIGVYIGARLGAAIAHRVRGRVLMIVFAVFLALTAVLMVLRPLNIIGGH